MTDLFQENAARYRAENAPLADRMRPRTLDEFVGQPHILGPGKLLRRAIEALVRILAPICPHICSELWLVLGHREALEAAGWPEYEEAELQADTVEYPVQVNGKVRGRIKLPSGLDKPALEEAARAHTDIQQLVGDLSEYFQQVRRDHRLRFDDRQTVALGLRKIAFRNPERRETERGVRNANARNGMILVVR